MTINEPVLITEKTAEQTTSIAYLAALNATQLMLLDLASLQRNNYVVYTSSLALAMQKLANGDSQGTLMLEAIEKSMVFEQAYVAKSGTIYAELLAEFKKL